MPTIIVYGSGYLCRCYFKNPLQLFIFCNLNFSLQGFHHQAPSLNYRNYEDKYRSFPPKICMGMYLDKWCMLFQRLYETSENHMWILVLQQEMEAIFKTTIRSSSETDLFFSILYNDYS